MRNFTFISDFWIEDFLFALQVVEENFWRVISETQLNSYLFCTSIDKVDDVT